jgi:hypothetical protein
VVHRVILFLNTLPFCLSSYWLSRLAAAGADYGLHLLTKSPTTSEQFFPFGGGLSGHHGKVHDMTFCGGQTKDGARYVATVSGNVIVRLLMSNVTDFAIR